MATKDTKPQSEKATDALLRKRIKAFFGKYIKLGTQYQSALPDRMCLLSGGRVVFVEVKSEGEKPTPLQAIGHRELRALGFRVEVIDTAEQAEQFIKSLSNAILICDVDRSIIADYYKRAHGKTVMWRYFNRNVIVARYEVLKAQRGFYKAVSSRLERSLIIKILRK